MSAWDVIIVGSGIVGATAALSLAKNTSLNIAVLDTKTHAPSWCKEKIDYRVSAISPSSKKIFQDLQVWDVISAKRISPYTKMQVWEENGGEIDFDAAAIDAAELGYIIENSAMRDSLLDAFSAHKNIHYLHPIELISLQEKNESVELVTKDQQVLSAKLLIAADGANSWVRNQLNIELKTWDYHHTAIVATVKTKTPHQKIARQRFLPTGPLAFLPLKEGCTSSIVWSCVPAYAEELLALHDNDFKTKLTHAFSGALGEVVEISARYHFPLRMRHVKNYVKPHIALIGDAAHTIHPLAGQGVNMGLQDAVCLSEVVLDAVQKRRDFSSFSTLRRYERARKGRNLMMLTIVEVLKRLFMSDKQPVQMARAVGLSAMNKLRFFKKLFIECAS